MLYHASSSYALESCILLLCYIGGKPESPCVYVCVCARARVYLPLGETLGHMRREDT
jgi:hypothetical protein